MNPHDVSRRSRRQFLRGAGGLAVGLPLLDIFTARRARAADLPIYSFFMVGCNGVMQRWPFAEEAEKGETFWPSLGDAKADEAFSLPLTKDALAKDTGRTTSEFAEYAEKLLLVKGVDHPFAAQGCTHHSGNQYVLTAAKISAGNDFQEQLAQGESIDTRIAREKNPDAREPLSLHAGETKAGGTGYGYPSYVSFKGARSPRAAEPNPLNAYMRIVGLAGMNADVAQRIAKGRLSVNDLLRAQIKRLQGRTDLSGADRKRLDQHFSSIRDIEVKLGAELDTKTIDAIKAMSGKEHDNAQHDAVVRLHLDLVAFALSSDYTRTAVLKMGDINDRTRWTLNGVLQPVFHMISHRVLSDGGEGPAIAGAQGLHTQIDRIQAKHFKYFLDKVRDIDTPSGKLLDAGFYCWTNQLGTGKYHGMRDIPWVIAGDARGFLRTGQLVNINKVFIDDKDRVKSNKFLSTLVSAAGVRKAGGALVDDFGDGSLAKGTIAEIIR